MTTKKLNDFDSASDYIAYMRGQKSDGNRQEQLTDGQIRLQIINTSDKYIRAMLDKVGLSYSQVFAVANLIDDFTLKGKAGGIFSYWKNWESNPDVKLRWNMDVIRINDFEHFLNQTVPHECAHLVVEIMYRQKMIRNSDRGKHNWVWQKLMLAVGKNPEVYHNYKVTAGRTVKRYVYRAEGCGCQMEFTGNRHNRVTSGKSSYVCNEHRNKLVWNGMERTIKAGEQY